MRVNFFLLLLASSGSSVILANDSINKSNLTASKQIIISNIIFKDKELSRKEFEKIGENFDSKYATLSMVVKYLINCRKYKNDATIKKILYDLPQQFEYEMNRPNTALKQAAQFKLMILFLEQCNKYPNDIKLLWGASQISENLDRGLSIKFLEKGKKLKEKDLKWAKNLGHLYSLQNHNKLSFLNYEYVYNKGNSSDQEQIVGSLSYSAFELEKYDKAKKYALQCLALASKKEDKYWNKNNLIFDGNNILGLVALQDNKLDEACDYLLKSGKTTGSPQLDSFGPKFNLANKLLKKGKEQAVIEFLNACSKYWKKELCQKWIKEIKAGKTPKLSLFGF